MACENSIPLGAYNRLLTYSFSTALLTINKKLSWCWQQARRV